MFPALCSNPVLAFLMTIWVKNEVQYINWSMPYWKRPFSKKHSTWKFFRFSKSINMVRPGDERVKLDWTKYIILLQFKKGINSCIYIKQIFTWWVNQLYSFECNWFIFILHMQCRLYYRKIFFYNYCINEISLQCLSADSW